MKKIYSIPKIEAIIIDHQCPLLELSGGSKNESITIKNGGDTSSGDNRVKANPRDVWDDDWSR